MRNSAALLWLGLLLLCLGLPFGVAVQTSLSLIAFLLGLAAHHGKWPQLWSSLSLWERRSFGAILAVLCLCALATALNPKNTDGQILAYFLGYAPFCLLVLLYSGIDVHDEQRRRHLRFFLAVLCLGWALLALSQERWGWKLSGSSLEWGERFRRAQGFYSHPLTLAYVALLLWVPSLGYAMQRQRDKAAWTIAAAVGFLLYASGSRMAQLLAAASALFLIFRTLTGRTRLIVLGACAASLLLVLSTKNMISDRFVDFRGKVALDRESPYADDRLAFWHAHIKAIEERPLLGHGVHLGRDYRQPYYEQIGLAGLKKMYEAHNQLLQLAFEGGLFAVLAFLAWLWSLHRSWEGLASWVARLRDLSVLVFLLGGMTQNAFFDSEVRYAIGLVWILAFLAAKQK